jgi:hypothetical protein
MARGDGCLTTPAVLDKLVEKGYMLEEMRGRCHVVPGEAAPHPRDGEVIIFTRFDERGLTFPAGRFLRGLLYHYGLELHHLSVFVVLCEAWFGIEPNLYLFRFYFSPPRNGWGGSHRLRPL